ncbi:MAG: hypothetical protein IIV87_04475 [Oscillospiraceae bacterium]|nr:hypothetical protein [Oscillospiraceae bacterium]
MSEQTFRSGLCPKCDKVLQIPVDLPQFSCMYCGTRLLADDVFASTEPVSDVDFDEACAKLVRCVTEYPGYNRRITRSDYVPAFEDYREGCEPIFRELDAAIRGGDCDALCETAAVRFLDELETVWKQSARWKNRASQSGLIDDDKLIIAIFMVPLVRHLRLPISEAFSQSLQKNWVERHPKTPFFIGEYEAIANGFRKKRFGGLCFITTAVCQAQGLGDDCPQLRDFRSFRDGYLRTCPDGAELINEYYDIAPGIVTCIDACGDRDVRYAAIRKTYLDPCWQDLKDGRMEQCKERYVQMVRDLQKQYLS